MKVKLIYSFSYGKLEKRINFQFSHPHGGALQLLMSDWRVKIKTKILTINLLYEEVARVMKGLVQDINILVNKIGFERLLYASVAVGIVGFILGTFVGLSHINWQEKTTK